jgi:hypothetical protein
MEDIHDELEELGGNYSNIEGMKLYRDRCESLVMKITLYFDTQVDIVDDRPDDVLPLTREEFLKLIDKVAEEIKED